VDTLLDLVWLFLGFLLLAKGAHWLVDGGASLARKWGVSPLMVGLTVVAWGTSMPELMIVSLTASGGDPASSLNTVIGSNVANIGLVLGSSALILPTILRGRIAAREAAWLFGSLGLMWAVCWNGVVTRGEAGLLLGAFVVHNWVLFRSAKADKARAAEAIEEISEHAEHTTDYIPTRPWTNVIIGSISIAGGAKLVIMGGQELAALMGVPPAFIALSVYAFGTSLPELAAGIGSALKGHADISIGNVIGSNVFNVLAVIGVAGLIAPLNGVVAGETTKTMGDVLQIHLPAALVFSIALVALPFLGKGGGRLKASLLVAAYVSYMIWQGISSGVGP